MSEEGDLRRRILEFLAENGEKPSGEIIKYIREQFKVLDRERVRYRLLMLAAEGLIERRVVTPKVIMWKITEKGREYLKTQQ